MLRPVPQEVNELALRAIKIPLFYVTDRAPSDKGALSYTSSRSDHLEYGQIEVTMPIEKEQRGEAEQASALLGWEKEGKGKDKSVVGDPVLLDQKEFFSVLDKARQSTPSGRVAVYVHGYSVDFDKSLRAAGRLAYHLQLPLVVFSGPPNITPSHIQWMSATPSGVPATSKLCCANWPVMLEIKIWSWCRTVWGAG